MPSFPACLSAALMLTQSARVMQHALDTIARLAVASQLQDALVAAGAVFRMLPLLFRYDPTLEAAAAGAGEHGRGVAVDANAPPPVSTPKAAVAATSSGGAVADAERNEQKAANMQAKLAVRAMARL